MTLPITIPNTFANATGNISLSLLDANFTTVANGVNGIGNGTNTLTNVVVSGGNISLTSLGYVGAANTIIASNGTSWVSTTNPSATILISSSSNIGGSNVAAVTGLDGTYGTYTIDFNLVPTANGEQLWLDVSTDNGATWKTTAAQYSRYSAENGNYNGASNYLLGARTDSMTNTAAYGGVTGLIWLFNLNGTTTYKSIQFQTSFTGTSNNFICEHGSLMWVNATTAINAVRIRTVTGGNISSGYLRLYGTKAS